MKKKDITKLTILGVTIILATSIIIPFSIRKDEKPITPVSADIGSAKLKISNSGETTYGYIANTFNKTSGSIIGVSFDISDVNYGDSSSKLMPFTIDLGKSFGSREVAANGGNGIQFLLARDNEGIQFGPSGYNKIMTNSGYTYSVNGGANVTMGASANTWISQDEFPFNKGYINSCVNQGGVATVSCEWNLIDGSCTIFLGMSGAKTYNVKFFNVLTMEQNAPYYLSFWSGSLYSGDYITFDNLKYYKDTTTLVDINFTDESLISYAWPFGTSKVCINSAVQSHEIIKEGMPWDFFNLPITLTDLYNNGMKFTSVFGTSLEDAQVNGATKLNNIYNKYGKNNVEVGILYIWAGALVGNLTLETEGALKCIMEEPYLGYAHSVELKGEAGIIAFRPYIKIVNGNKTFINYGEQKQDYVSNIAKEAYNDRSSTQSSKYQYYDLVNNNYSPYTMGQRKKLENMNPQLVCAKTLNVTKLKQNLDARANSDMTEGKILGSNVFVYQNGKEVFKENYGYARVDKSEALTDNSIFRLASCSKPLCAIAVLKEVERGRLNLNDPITKYLPQYSEMYLGRIVGDNVEKTTKVNTPITLRMLLTHSSGIGSGDVPVQAEIWAMTNAPESYSSIDNAVNYWADIPIQFEPDTMSIYSAWVTFDIMAKLIEIVSGKDYSTYLKEEVLIPLEMYDTGFIPTDDQLSRLVDFYGYNPETKQGYKDWIADGCIYAYIPWTHPVAGAGVFSTITDYSHFAMMLCNEGVYNGKRILKAETVRMLYESWLVPGTPTSVDWTLGMRRVDRADYPYLLPVSSYGWSGAYGAHFWVDPVNKITAVYLKNSSYDGGAGAVTANNFELDVCNALE